MKVITTNCYFLWEVKYLITLKKNIFPSDKRLEMFELASYCILVFLNSTQLNSISASLSKLEPWYIIMQYGCLAENVQYEIALMMKLAGLLHRHLIQKQQNSPHLFLQH